MSSVISTHSSIVQPLHSIHPVATVSPTTVATTVVDPYGHVSTVVEPAIRVEETYIEEVRTQIVDLRQIETTLWTECEAQRRHIEELTREKTVIEEQYFAAQRIADDRAKHAVDQMRALLRKYETDIQRLTGENTQLATVLNETSRQVKEKESVLNGMLAKIQGLATSLKETEGNLAQWKNAYEDMRLRGTQLDQLLQSKSEELRIIETRYSAQLSSEHAQLQQTQQQLHEEREADLRERERLTAERNKILTDLEAFRVKMAEAEQNAQRLEAERYGFRQQINQIMLEKDEALLKFREQSERTVTEIREQQRIQQREYGALLAEKEAMIESLRSSSAVLAEDARLARETLQREQAAHSMDIQQRDAQLQDTLLRLQQEHTVASELQAASQRMAAEYAIQQQQYNQLISDRDVTLSTLQTQLAAVQIDADRAKERERLLAEQHHAALVEMENLRRDKEATQWLLARQTVTTHETITPVVTPIVVKEIVHHVVPAVTPITVAPTVISGAPLTPVKPGKLRVHVMEGGLLAKTHHIGHSKPYVVLAVGSTVSTTQHTKSDRSRSAVWNEVVEFEVADAFHEFLKVALADHHRLRHDETIAYGRPIPLGDLQYNVPQTVVSDTGAGQVSLRLELVPPPGHRH